MLTFDGAEDKQGEDGVVQATGCLGNAGQDGERVQQVTGREIRRRSVCIPVTCGVSAPWRGCRYLQHGYFQRDVEHLFGAPDELQAVCRVALGLQGKLLLSELRNKQCFIATTLNTRLTQKQPNTEPFLAFIWSQKTNQNVVFSVKIHYFLTTCLLKSFTAM